MSRVLPETPSQTPLSLCIPVPMQVCPSESPQEGNVLPTVPATSQSSSREVFNSSLMDVDQQKQVLEEQIEGLVILSEKEEIKLIEKEQIRVDLPLRASLF